MAGWFTMPDLATLTAQVNGLTQSLGEGATKIGQEIQQKVTSLASFELEDIGKAIQNAEEDILAEETKIKQEDAGLKQAPVKILPWETRIENKSIFGQTLMEKVLALSLEESNFTTATAQIGKSTEVDNDDVEGETSDDTHRCTASTATPATFPLERHINVAVKMLSLDPNLAKIHARLIASMPEKTFWFHYFSRIAALRNEVGIEPLCEDLPKAAFGVSSDEYEKISHGDAQSIASPSDVPQHLDHRSDQDEDGDDFSDLGDLDDLDDDSDSNIDATLEAEIAAEIGDT